MPSHREAPVLTSRSTSDELVLDAQTFKDLQIVESDTAGSSLFDRCNFTRHAGGAKALRARLKRPWSNPVRIRAVQDSIAFVLAHRELFDRSPSSAAIEVVENYLYGIPLLVMSSNGVEFAIDALVLRFGDASRYRSVERGVKSTISMVRALRRVAFAPELASAPGELASLLEEMRELLSRRAFSGIPDQEARSMGVWTVLRTDQVFRINDHHAVERLLRLTYEVDALLSMADATRKHGFVMPNIEDGPLAVHGEGIVHPLVPAAVPNPLDLDQTHRLLFLTGPNMAGKTTYLRACGIAIYLAHVGMGVPARAFRFVPAQRLFSSINLTDHPQGGVSFFRAEALRIKAIAQALADGSRVVALMDEPFKGTNVKDALDASRAVLERFAAREGSLFIFTSHLIELSEPMRAISQVDCRRFEAGEHEGRLRFDYVLQPGVSSQRLGMHVLREEGILELLDGN